ncbi:MAG TPA: hypothetical protein VG738_25405 [Chitinophagaceae bacterium]|nr:hypothetical protein [Chitinophagaceae bacterium]
MKKFIAAALLFSVIVLACNTGNQQMQAKIDSLQRQLDSAYKPGLGEFMSDIQLHHAKLYFAGQKANWKLADFEMHEIMEALDDIKHYAADRPESKLVTMLNPALDSLNVAISQQSGSSFNKGFILLTNTCNECHQAVHYDFNKIKIPSAPPVTNQEF